MMYRFAFYQVRYNLGVVAFIDHKTKRAWETETLGM